MLLASGCYRCLLDFKTALPLVQRWVVLEQELAGPRSLRHAQALQDLCIVQRGLKDFVAAGKAIKEALAIMEELGLQRHEGYGSMLLDLGGLDFHQGRHKEALAIMEELGLQRHKEYGLLLLSVLLLPANTLSNPIATRSMWATNTACATSAARSRRRWSGVLDAAVCGIAKGVPAAALGHAQAAVQCLFALRCGADQDQALLALPQGQVLRRRVQQGPLERAQKGLRGAVRQVRCFGTRVNLNVMARIERKLV